MPFVPKNIFVWNKKMKKEALEHYQEYKPNIYIVGSPQYDNLKLIKKIDKEKSNLVLYCSNSPLSQTIRFAEIAKGSGIILLLASL